jgi:hypothetical protein
MSVFKSFLTSDTIVSPLQVNKSFTFQGIDGYGYVNYGTTAIYGGIFNSLNDAGVALYVGVNTPTLPFVPSQNTGYVPFTQNNYLVYKSIEQLYYSNYLLNPTLSPASTASFNIDGTITGPQATTNYYNYLTDTLPPNRIFPTGANDMIGVVSIPSKVFGEYIKLGSFRLENPTGSIYDDGQGNLLLSSSIYQISDYHVGNIIYEHGIAIVNKNLISAIDGYSYVSYGTSSVLPVGIYGGLFPTFFLSNTVSCSFESTTTIYEAQYKCTARENEFNFSQNSTIIDYQNGYDISVYNQGNYYDSFQDFLCYLSQNVPFYSQTYGFTTSSYFSPYVTTVGLYNNNYELLAVAKLSQPLPLSQVTDTTILVNLDL